MTILLFILKIIGILLLSILGILLLLVALVLCVPVRYRVEGSEEEERRIAGKVHWLLHVVSFSFSYEEKQFGYRLRIFGIPILPREKKMSALDDTDFEEDTEELPETDKAGNAEAMASGEGNIKAEISEAGDAETGISAEKIEKSPNRTENETEPHGNGKNPAEHQAVQKKAPKRKRKQGASPWQKIRSFYEKVKQTVHKVLHFLKQLRGKIEDIKKLLTDETNKKSVSLVWKELKYLLRHSRFRKIKTDLTFSLGDPAVTGQTLGVLCMFPVLYQYEIKVSPDFETEHIYIRGTYLIKGHIRLLHFLLSGIRLWKEKDFRRFVKQIMKKLER